MPRRGNRLYNNYDIYQSVMQFKIVIKGPKNGPYIVDFCCLILMLGIIGTERTFLSVQKSPDFLSFTRDIT